MVPWDRALGEPNAIPYLTIAHLYVTMVAIKVPPDIPQETTAQVNENEAQDTKLHRSFTEHTTYE